MRLDKLLNNVEFIRLIGEWNIEISNITLDSSENIKNGMLIIPRERTVLPTRDLLNAFSAIICESPVFEQLTDLHATTICVENARIAWAAIASNLYEIDCSRLKIIAVTGTNGKTSTATMIKQILEYAGHKVGFIGTGKISIGENLLSSNDYSMTTPDPTLLCQSIRKMQDESVDFIVMEVSSHSLYYDKVSALKFELALFTNISPEHLDFHGSISEYLKAKLKLLSLSKKALFNIDDYLLRGCANDCTIPKKTTGILWRGDSYATDIIETSKYRTSFMYRGKDYGFKAELNLPGRFNVYNALMAISAAIELGVKPCIAKKAISLFKGVEGRYEIAYDGDITVVIDYAHTEAAFESLLLSLKKHSRGGKTSVVFGCGGERYREKRASIAKIAEKFAERIYVTSDNSRREPPAQIFSDIKKGFSCNAPYKLIEDRREAINVAIYEADEGDTVALVGKGAEKYNIDAEGYHSFNERSIIAEAIANRRRKNASYS